MGKWLAMLEENEPEEFSETLNEVAPVEVDESRALTVKEQSIITAWLSHIGETDSLMIEDCLVRSERMPDVRKYFLNRAMNELPEFK